MSHYNIQNQIQFLKSLVGDDYDIIQEIISEMKLQWALDCSDLKIAVSANDPIEVRRILHRLKSTFAPLGVENEIYLLLIIVSDILKSKKSVNVTDYEKFESTMNGVVDDFFKFAHLY